MLLKLCCELHTVLATNDTNEVGTETHEQWQASLEQPLAVLLSAVLLQDAL
jgi:hypothetical protein